MTTAKSDSFNDLVAIFGEPADESNLVFIVPAYPLKYDGKNVSKIRCHKLISNQLENVFKEVLKAYGLEQIFQLYLNVYGGSYNNRPIRGGTKPSTHAWGIAIDMFPTGNSLNANKDKAAFARPEYKKWMDIWRANGFYNLGEVKNYDFMHFQAAKPE